MIRFKNVIINPKCFIAAGIVSKDGNHQITIELTGTTPKYFHFETEAGAKIGLDTLYKLLNARKK